MSNLANARDRAANGNSMGEPQSHPGDASGAPVLPKFAFSQSGEVRLVLIYAIERHNACCSPNYPAQNVGRCLRTTRFRGRVVHSTFVSAGFPMVMAERASRISIMLNLSDQLEMKPSLGLNVGLMYNRQQAEVQDGTRVSWQKGRPRRYQNWLRCRRTAFRQWVLRTRFSFLVA